MFINIKYERILGMVSHSVAVTYLKKKGKNRKGMILDVKKILRIAKTQRIFFVMFAFYVTSS